jgi:hypothetical protein
MGGLTARSGFGIFIKAAERHDLPVGFLRYVSQSSYTYSTSDSSSYVLPTFNHMVLEEGAVESGANLALPLPMGESSAVQTIYHETTHAWLDLKENDPEVSALMKHGETYYRSAPLLRGAAKADDPSRLFHEAMGSYVGHRAGSYWAALEGLSIVNNLATKGIDPAKRAKIIRMARSARSEYGRAMGERVFGYQNGPGWFSAFREQNDTTKIISDKMKDFCDRTLLETKIPEQFERKSKLVELWNQLRTKFYPDLG